MWCMKRLMMILGSWLSTLTVQHADLPVKFSMSEVKFASAASSLSDLDIAIWVSVDWLSAARQCAWCRYWDFWWLFLGSHSPSYPISTVIDLFWDVKYLTLKFGSYIIKYLWCVLSICACHGVYFNIIAVDPLPCNSWPYLHRSTMLQYYTAHNSDDLYQTSCAREQKDYSLQLVQWARETITPCACARIINHD